MNFLIFFISLLFSAIFYVLYLANNEQSIFGIDFSSISYFDSLSSNLLIESIVFIILGLMFYIYFSDFSFNRKGINKMEKKEILNKKILSNIKLFFKDYLYYIGFIFLYLGIYFIYKDFAEYSFSYIILFINIVIFSLFFINSKFKLFRDFIKINTILFSIYFLVYYLYFFILKQNNFFIIDFINSIFVMLSFVLVFYNDYKILKNKKLDEIMLIYFSIFLSGFLSFYSFISGLNITYVLFFVSFFINILYYFILQKVYFLQYNKIILRIISIIFSYLSILLGFFIFINYGFNFIIFLILSYFLYFNIQIHKKYENYISFGFSNLIIIFIIYFSYFKIFLNHDDGLIFLILSLVLSLEYIILSYFFEFKYNFDYYFIHIFSYVFNFCAIVFYLFYFEIDLFSLGIIFFIESFYIFLSYFKLRQIKLIEK